MQEAYGLRNLGEIDWVNVDENYKLSEQGFDKLIIGEEALEEFGT